MTQGKKTEAATFSVHVALVAVRRSAHGGTIGQLEGEGDMRNPSFYCELATDDRGWPLIKFDPEDDDLRLAGEFLQDDVGMLSSPCDELRQGLESVVHGREEEWVWNGDRFLVRVRKDQAEMIDKFGGDGSATPPVAIDTPLLVALVRAWSRFVAAIPRQREFGSSRPA